MPTADFDVAVIGAGVIGLAVARALAVAGASVLVVERASHFGTETSSRNSEVIHAGIYYPPKSLKARLCLAGRELLYAFCAAHGVPHRRCGKLIVATGECQIRGLEKIREGAAACGVENLSLIDANEVARCEPAVSAVAALLSPDTGIIDSHAYMQALLGIAEAHGAILACRSTVTAIKPDAAGWAISIASEIGAVLSARMIVNAAGLDADRVAHSIVGYPAQATPRLRYAKGSYFGYAGATPFSHLIYPLPEPGGLGTHLTLDMAGRARFGPDVEWVDTPDYQVDPAKRARFADAVRRFWPDADPDRLHPDYAGVRPKLSGPNEPAADFVISGPRDHGVRGVIHLFGIESPGLTASLAIADEVAGHWREAA
jgi:L-2-hydroxyglutarate oxidase LhgO